MTNASLFIGHFFKTWAYCWIRRHFMNYLFGMCWATSGATFTACLCPSVATWSNKVEDVKFALPLIKVMFVWGISFSFSSCDLQIVQIIFLSPPESVTKSQGNLSICWLSSLLGLFCPFQLNFIASSEKNLGNTSFNLWKVKESLQQLLKD